MEENFDIFAKFIDIRSTMLVSCFLKYQQNNQNNSLFQYSMGNEIQNFSLFTFLGNIPSKVKMSFSVLKLWVSDIPILW